MRRPPLQILLVLSQHVIDHLIQDVFSRFADEGGVCVERLVGLVIETRAVPDELLAASAGLISAMLQVLPVLRLTGCAAEKRATLSVTGAGECGTIRARDGPTSCGRICDTSGRERPPSTGVGRPTRFRGGRSRPDSSALRSTVVGGKKRRLLMRLAPAAKLVDCRTCAGRRASARRKSAQHVRRSGRAGGTHGSGGRSPRCSPSAAHSGRSDHRPQLEIGVSKDMCLHLALPRARVRQRRVMTVRPGLADPFHPTPDTAPEARAVKCRDAARSVQSRNRPPSPRPPSARSTTQFLDDTRPQGHQQFLAHGVSVGALAFSQVTRNHKPHSPLRQRAQQLRVPLQEGAKVDRAGRLTR